MQMFSEAVRCTNLIIGKFKRNRVVHNKVRSDSFCCEVRPLGCQGFGGRSRMMTKRHPWRLMKIHKWPLSEHLTWEKWQMDLRGSLMKHPWNSLMLPERVDRCSIIRLVSHQQCFLQLIHLDYFWFHWIPITSQLPLHVDEAKRCKQSPLLLRRLLWKLLKQFL